MATVPLTAAQQVVCETVARRMVLSMVSDVNQPSWVSWISLVTVDRQHHDQTELHQAGPSHGNILSYGIGHRLWEYREQGDLREIRFQPAEVGVESVDVVAVTAATVRSTAPSSIATTSTSSTTSRSNAIACLMRSQPTTAAAVDLSPHRSSGATVAPPAVAFDSSIVHDIAAPSLAAIALDPPPIWSMHNLPSPSPSPPPRAAPRAASYRPLPSGPVTSRERDAVWYLIAANSDLPPPPRSIEPCASAASGRRRAPSPSEAEHENSVRRCRPRLEAVPAPAH